MSAEELSQPDMASNEESGPELKEVDAEEDEDEDRSPASSSSSVEAFGSLRAGIGQMIELRSRKCGLAGRTDGAPFWFAPFLGARYRALSLLKVVSNQACFLSRFCVWPYSWALVAAPAGKSGTDAFAESTSVRRRSNSLLREQVKDIIEAVSEAVVAVDSIAALRAAADAAKMCI